jgi:16S rRNA (uracil1498-N3)-methyltransferase
LSRYDFAAQRLFIDAELDQGAQIDPSPEAQNYLVNVLRLRDGEPILLFNGRQGEWRARLMLTTRRKAKLHVEDRLREQDAPGDLDYVFAPLKQARLDYMAQKATEMGASRLIPVITRRTQARRVNVERLRANAIEAAEQCGILTPPQVMEALDLDAFLAAFPAERLLVFCDEDAEQANPVEALRLAPPHEGVSVLIGPEGGFDPTERASIGRLAKVVRLSLGPRILRADTAAVAALALTQAVWGD